MPTSTKSINLHSFDSKAWDAIRCMTLGLLYCLPIRLKMFMAELSMGWVDIWVGLGRDFSVFGRLGWVRSTIAKVLKI